VDVYGTLLFDPAFGERWLRGTSLPQILKDTEAIIDRFAPEFP
jgi:hypothetical protein